MKKPIRVASLGPFAFNNPRFNNPVVSQASRVLNRTGQGAIVVSRQVASSGQRERFNQARSNVKMDVKKARGIF